jgi:hypothetical protein
MATHLHLTDRELAEIETLACDAAAGPLEPAGSTLTPEEAEERFHAAMDPEAALRMVREIRRLRRVEERFERLCGVVEHLNTFLERRGLAGQAQRFVEVRAQLADIHPDASDGGAPAAAVSVA